MAAFQDLGRRRVAKTISEFFQPATTVVLLPNFFRAMSTTALGCIAEPGSDPEGQNSVRIGPGHSACTEIPSLRSSFDGAAGDRHMMLLRRVREPRGRISSGPRLARRRAALPTPFRP